MSTDKPIDPQAPPDDAALRTHIEKLGNDIDRLEEEALPPPAKPADVGGMLGT